MFAIPTILERGDERMPKWLRKTLITLVTVLTLGTVVPTFNVHQESKKPDSGEQRPKASRGEFLATTGHEAIGVETVEERVSEWPEIAALCQTRAEMLEQLERYAAKEATAQGFEKFGPAIAGEIGAVYVEDIVPRFADAVASLGATVDDETLRHLMVSRHPAGGTGERILHFYDGRTGEELIKFHVRRDHPPQEGYWFNFHYHTYQDGFQEHHEIAKVYWDKNMPPKWMA